MERWFINPPDRDLAYLPEGTEHFDDYVEAVHWAQTFARRNRELMMRPVMAGMHEPLHRLRDEMPWSTVTTTTCKRSGTTARRSG